MVSVLRRSAAGVGVAIVVVLGNQWRLAIFHLRDSRTDDVLPPSRPTRGPSRRPARSEAASASYVLSPMCGGCSRSRSKMMHCAQIISDRRREENSTLLEAAAIVGRDNEGCEICDKYYCLRNRLKDAKRLDRTMVDRYQTKYWRFDRSGPNVTKSASLVLTSIPSGLRIPPSRFDDISAYFQEQYKNSPPKQGMQFLLEYNPGIVALPRETKRYLPVAAAYLLSLRVTPANNCFREKTYAGLPEEVWRAIYHGVTNHLGLALLDEDYRIVPGFDVVVELGSQLGLKRPPAKFESPQFMDYRLFVLNDEIFLHANADTVVVTKLSLRAREFANDDKVVNGTAQSDPKRLDQPYKLENLYGGDNLEVTLRHQFNTIWSGGIYGKNYALFAVPNATHPGAPDSMYAEIDITPHHKVQQIAPDDYEQLTKTAVFENIWKLGTKKRRRVDTDIMNMREVVMVGNATESGNPPLPSFSTLDEHWFPGADAPFKEYAHGGACCVQFSAVELNLDGAKNDHRESLLVGIAHTKVSWKPWYNRKNVPQERKDRVPHTHYVSFFYAFDFYPPFQIRARSGYFCLGHAPPSSGDKVPSAEGGAFNPRSILTRNRLLQQNNVTFDCPQMHYISSFLTKVGDSSSTIIGYGLNDCTSRLVEVKKMEVVRLLYPDPMDMLFEAT